MNDPTFPSRRDTWTQLSTELEAGVNRLYTAVVLEITLRGRPLFLASRGVLDPDEPSSLTTPESLFDIASVTKPFVAIAFMRLVERHQALLDSRVRSVIPEFAGQRKDEVTFRHLLNHTSGLPASLKTFLSRFPISDPGDLKRAVLQCPLGRSPGHRPVYSDLNFLILGDALERITSAPLSVVISEEVTRPLDLRNTIYSPPSNVVCHVAVTSREGSITGLKLRGLVHDPTARFLGGVSGHAGLFSCAKDVTKLAGLFISNDLSIGFLKPATSKLMVQPSATSEGDRRGLGWALNSGGLVPGRAFSELAFGHNGFTGVSVWADPADGLTVTLLTNRVYFSEAKAWRPVNYFRNRVHRLAKLLLKAT